MAEWTESIGLLVAVLALVGIVGRITHNVYRWAQRMEAAIVYVEAEMRMDGGSTIRDAINRIEIELKTYREK
jgi:hypothetical protein